MLIIVNWPVNYFTCVQHTTVAFIVVRRPSECRANPIVWIRLRFGPQNWLPAQCPLRDRKQTSDLSSTDTLQSLRNLGKICPVDVQIIGLIEIVKKETTAERISHLRLVGRKINYQFGDVK